MPEKKMLPGATAALLGLPKATMHPSGRGRWREYLGLSVTRFADGTTSVLLNRMGPSDSRVIPEFLDDVPAMAGYEPTLREVLLFWAEELALAEKSARR